MTDRTKPALIQRLRVVVGVGASEALVRAEFTTLFQAACSFLQADDERVSRLCDTSLQTVRRWREGTEVPSEAKLVLRTLLAFLHPFDGASS